MRTNNVLLLTAAINGLLAVSSIQPAAAATAKEKDEKIELLERRLLLLEQRLEAAERSAKAPVPVPASAPASDATIQALDQKVKILERKNEVDKEIAAEAAKTAPKFEAGPKGVIFSSADGNNSVRLRASVQADGRFFVDDESKVKDRFELKQARIWVEGRLWKYFDYKIMPDFGANQTILADAYVDVHYFPFASLNVGKQKTPISLERLQGDSDGTFMERAYPTYLASNRDVGVKLHGSFARPGDKVQYAGPIDFKNFFTYEVGVFNGGGDNGASDSDKENEDNKEVAARLWAHPFQNSGNKVLDGLGVGVAGSWEVPNNNKTSVKSLKSALGQNTLVDYTKVGTGATEVAADGEHYRIYPQAYWYYGPYGLLGEYVLSSQQLTGDGGNTHIQQDNTAWQIQASYVVTGENNTFQSVKPRSPFDPFNGQWGALQLAARWSELSIDEDTFKPVNGVQLLNPSNSIREASSWALGANWFLNQNTRLMADYENTHFTGGARNGGDRPAENVFSTRLQLVF
ncbi:OprO/OprP family phosphate-selective porin [Methylobacter sp.]|uniref:OprO/OprP family phosphate-selective porin n=1 Tax=Methylobacter sp. TaxID=2051955 RepID=UPI003DA3F587